MRNPQSPTISPQRSYSQQPPTTPDAPLHQEIRSVISLNTAHSQKIYFSGPLVQVFDRNADGHKPHKDQKWRDVWAQLYGTTLAIWDMVEVKIAHQQGREVPPSYANTIDAFVSVLGSLIRPATQTSSRRRFPNVFILNTAGANALYFSCPSAQDLISWTSAFRLSYWERSRLEEIYSAYLIRTTLNDGGNIPSTLTNGRLEGWVRVRIAGQTDWKRLWMCLSAGSATLSSINAASTDSKSPLIGRNSRHSSYVAPKKRCISGLFSRDRLSVLPEQANISFYIGPQGKERKTPLLTFGAVTQAFAVYPERQYLVDVSTLIKLEGTYGEEDICGNMKRCEGWMLLMPDLEGADSASGEVVKWLIGIHDAFEIYGRPGTYSWDPWNPVSMMFAYPFGPEKQRLFLDRDIAETLDPREYRTPVVHSKLLHLMVERMQSGPVSGTNQDGKGTGRPRGKNRNRQPSLGSIPSAPELGALPFEQARQQDDDWDQPPPYPGNWRL